MICYFWESLKPSIKVDIEYQDRESINFEEIVQKKFNIEAIAGLKSSTIVRDSDIHYPKNHHFFISIALKMQI